MNDERVRHLQGFSAIAYTLFLCTCYIAFPFHLARYFAEAEPHHIHMGFNLNNGRNPSAQESEISVYTYRYTGLIRGR